MSESSSGKPSSGAGVPDAPKRPSSFFEALVSAAASAGPALSPMEVRLVTIASQLMSNMIVMVRCSEVGRSEPFPLSAEVVQEAARLSLAGAAEMEAQLHRLRDAAKGKA